VRIERLIELTLGLPCHYRRLPPRFHSRRLYDAPQIENVNPTVVEPFLSAASVGFATAFASLAAEIRPTPRKPPTAFFGELAGVITEARGRCLELDYFVFLTHSLSIAGKISFQGKLSCARRIPDRTFELSKRQ
jgi:hypothetical protein